MNETETQEVPKWLKELEEKRERRLKAKLGHEAGAGSPCLACEHKCPGLDLHFWRKICKNCKCGKEDHDVNDDDIYGWAQFQLLGSKPNKLRKFNLPGRKDAVELEWTPGGQKDVVESYLKDLPLNCLPIKGSHAAQQRKQLLQKQIPLHDIDPTLCHALTDEEIKQMNDYIAHIKQNSVGVGHIMKLEDIIQSATPQIISSRAPMQVPQVEKIVLQGANRTNSLGRTGLSKPLQDLSLDQKTPYDILEMEQKMFNPGGVHNVIYGSYKNQDQTSGGLKNLQVPRPPVANQIDYQNPGVCGIRDINHESKFGSDRVVHHPDLNINFQEPVTSSELLDDVKNLNSSLSHYAAGKFNTFVDQQNPRKIGNIKDLAYSTYDSAYKPPFSNNSRGATALNNKPCDYIGATNNKNQLQQTNYTPHELNILEENVSPVQVNVNNLERSNDFCKAPFNNLPMGVVGATNRSQPKLINYNPNELTIAEQNVHPVTLNVNNFESANNYPLNNQPVKLANDKNQLKPTNYNPNELNITEQNVNPVPVNVGIISDLEYPTVKTALEHQDIFEPQLPRKHFNLNLTPEELLPSCHKCNKMFDATAIVIGIERTDALWHAECFRCKGCNQNLADLMYFYHKDSDDIYCGRDYAKIRGIPRCKACDELIFVKEYCLAEDSTFHVKHFCCFECDKPLAGQKYVAEDSQPMCLPCFENNKSEICGACRLPIKPDEPGLQLNKDAHFHANEMCFVCVVCQKPLFECKLLFKNKTLYCSAPCFGAHKSLAA